MGKAAYKTGDFEFCTTIGNPGKSNDLSASFFHNVNSTTSWGCMFSQGKGDSLKSRSVNLLVGAEFKNNSSMTTKFGVNQNGVGQFKVAQPSRFKLLLTSTTLSLMLNLALVLKWACKLNKCMYTCQFYWNNSPVRNIKHV